MATKLWAMSLAFLCAILVSTAQIFLKIGMQAFPDNIWALIIGIIIYGSGFVLLMVAFKMGDVTVIFPTVATSFIFVTILAMLIFHEPISTLKWIGVATIFAGVTFIGVSKK